MDELDLGATIRSFSKDQKVFGRYTLIRIIGRGGMGIVWLARDDKLARDVALKFLPEIVAQDARAIDDLKRETRRSLELTHPNIVRIYDFVDDARTAAISMEYVAGDNLSKRGSEQPHRVFPLGLLRPWVKQLCDALTYAHTKAKIVHLDLKPANLMLDAFGDLKVADFGIAANLSDSVSRVTQRAGTSGTPVYMSPQQMMGEPPAVTDDIYALGATLYDLLTGKPPFYSGNIAMQVSDKVAPSVNERRQVNAPGAEPMPPAWEATIAACLAKKAEDRPQSAREVWERLNVREVTASPATREAIGGQESGVERQKAVPESPPAKQQPEIPVARSPTPPITAREAPSGEEGLKGAKSTNPAPTDAVTSSLSEKNLAKAGTSVAKEFGDNEPPPSEKKPGGKLFRRGFFTTAGVMAGIVAAAVFAFVRYGNPTSIPEQVSPPLAMPGNPVIKSEALNPSTKSERLSPGIKPEVPNPNIKPAVPEAWINLCRAWDTWLIDLKANGPRYLRTEELWEEDDPLRRELADFVTTSDNLLPATLVPEAAGEKRLGVLASSPSQAVQNELQKATVDAKVSEAYKKVQNLASQVENWLRWSQLRSLQQFLNASGLKRSASALQPRLPPRPDRQGYQLNSARTLRLFNELSLDESGLLLVASRWSEITRLSADMAASGDRVQAAMPAMVLGELTDGPSLGELGDSLHDLCRMLGQRRRQFLRLQADRELFLRGSPLQKETAPVTPADISRWEQELAFYGSDFSAATREQLQTLGIYVRGLQSMEETSHARGNGIFIDIPARERPLESDYVVAAARIENQAVQEVLRLATITGLIGGEQGKLDEVGRALAAAFKAFSAVATKADAAGFRAWLEKSPRPDAVQFLAYIKNLKEALRSIELLGVTRQELEGSKAQIYGSILRARLNAEPEFMRELVEGPAPARSG